MEWHKRTEITEHYDLLDGIHEAHVSGYGKDWVWSAFVWSAPLQVPPVAFAEGEANDVESAKDNVRRFFADVAKAS